MNSILIIVIICVIGLFTLLGILCYNYLNNTTMEHITRGGLPCNFNSDPDTLCCVIFKITNDELKRIDDSEIKQLLNYIIDIISDDELLLKLMQISLYNNDYDLLTNHNQISLTIFKTTLKTSLQDKLKNTSPIVRKKYLECFLADYLLQNLNNMNYLPIPLYDNYNHCLMLNIYAFVPRIKLLENKSNKWCFKCGSITTAKSLNNILLSEFLSHVGINKEIDSTEKFHIVGVYTLIFKHNINDHRLITVGLDQAERTAQHCLLSSMKYAVINKNITNDKKNIYPYGCTTYINNINNINNTPSVSLRLDGENFMFDDVLLDEYEVNKILNNAAQLTMRLYNKEQIVYPPTYISLCPSGILYQNVFNKTMKYISNRSNSLIPDAISYAFDCKELLPCGINNNGKSWNLNSIVVSHHINTMYIKHFNRGIYHLNQNNIDEKYNVQFKLDKNGCTCRCENLFDWTLYEELDDDNKKYVFKYYMFNHINNIQNMNIDLNKLLPDKEYDELYNFMHNIY